MDGQVLLLGKPDEALLEVPGELAEGWRGAKIADQVLLESVEEQVGRLSAAQIAGEHIFGEVRPRAEAWAVKPRQLERAGVGPGGFEEGERQAVVVLGELKENPVRGVGSVATTAGISVQRLYR